VYSKEEAGCELSIGECEACRWEKKDPGFAYHVGKLSDLFDGTAASKQSFAAPDFDKEDDWDEEPKPKRKPEDLHKHICQECGYTALRKLRRFKGPVKGWDCSKCKSKEAFMP